MKLTTTVPGLTLFPGMGGQPAWSKDLSVDTTRLIIERIEASGIDVLVIPWHLAIREGDWERNMGPRWPHSLAAAGMLLGMSRELTVAPLVVAPCHQPIELAKALATLDWMSGGRCLPVILSGYLEWEFELLGADFDRRDAITDEYVEVLSSLFAGGHAFAGDHVAFDEVVFAPRPARVPLPMWFGGRSRASLRRVARWGGGWMSYSTPHERIAVDVRYIREHAGRDLGHLDVFAYFVEATHDRISHEEAAPPEVPVGDAAVVEQLERLAGCGVNATTAPLGSFGRGPAPTEPTSLEEYLERLEWIGEVVVPAARRLTPGSPPRSPRGPTRP